MLRVEALTKRFGGFTAVDRLSFEVREGEILGLIGPNGSGKSTTFNLIAGLYEPTSGSVQFQGREIGGLAPNRICRAGLARTFQIPRPFVDMTVFENVYVGSAFGASAHGQAGYAAAARALEVTGLAHLSDKPAGSLRLLDRKRLELARALATDPQLILLDEIAGGLTEKELPPLVELIRSLRDSGVTVIWIEHIVHALTAVVDELMCLALGQVLAIGDPQEVIRSQAVIDVYLGSTFDLGGEAS